MRTRLFHLEFRDYRVEGLGSLMLILHLSGFHEAPPVSNAEYHGPTFFVKVGCTVPQIDVTMLLVVLRYV